MRHQRRKALKPVCALLLASCGQATNDANGTVTAKLPRATAIAAGVQGGEETEKPVSDKASLRNLQASATRTDPRQGMRSRYTSLELGSCRLLEEPSSVSGSPRWRCTGTAGYNLETNATDPQQLAIIRPDGEGTDLTLPKIGTNITLGNLAEWRGEATGQPRALIVRLSAQGRPRISSLVVVKLGAAPCIVAVIGRRPGQNEKARIVADGEQLKCSSS